MRVVDLAVLYALVGLGCAVVLLVRRGHGLRQLGDAAILLVLWPAYGPFLMITAEDARAPSVGFLSSLQAARGTPLASFLPDEQTCRALAERLETATRKIDEIDRLLAQPEFSEDEARARHRELTDRGDERAAATALRRVENIRRLQSLQRRFIRELDEVNELLAQLRIQAEVVRLAPRADNDIADLVRELMNRVEGLDAVLELESQG